MAARHSVVWRNGGETLAIGEPSYPTNDLRFEGFTYWTTNGEVVISSYRYGTNSSIKVPASIPGLRVSCIGSSAFNYCNNMKDIRNVGWPGYLRIADISIPSSVFNIERTALLDTSAANITLAEGVVNIGESSFQASRRLRSLTIPSTFCGRPTAIWTKADVKP